VGLNEYGQLGVGDKVNRLSPTMVSYAIKFREIICRFSHTIGIDLEGNIYTWGNN